MPERVQLREASVADAYEIARAEANGFSKDPVFTWFANYNDRSTPEALTFSAYRTKERLVSADSVVIIASTESSDVAGVATWQFRPLGRRSFDTPMKTLQRPCHSWQSWLYHKLWTDKTYNPERERHFFAKNYALHDDVVDLQNAKNGFWYLSVLYTVASERRKGVAAALLKWGKERAREDNVPLFLESSPAGLPFYLNAGFKKVGEVEINGEGIDGVMTERPMILRHVIWHP